MSIDNIINEEFSNFLNEIEIGNVPAYKFEQQTPTKYRMFIEEPDRTPAISARFEVTFHEVSRDQHVWSLAFREESGNYDTQTGFGVQFKTLATVSKVVKDFLDKNEVNVINFQPVVTGNKYNPRTGRKKNVDPNQRLKLYMEFVKAGAGDEFDAFSFKDGKHVNIERTNPSYPIQNGVQDPDEIQDMITQLSSNEGYFESSDVGSNDPNYAMFKIVGNSLYMGTGNGERKSTYSARQYYDWMLDYPALEYVQGNYNPNRVTAPDRPDQQHVSRQATVQPVGGSTSQPQPIAHAEMGTFQHFLQSEVWGNPDFEILSPYFESAKTIESFDELRDRAEFGLSAARSSADTERLQGIIRAIDGVKQNYQTYLDVYGSNVNEILNEVKKTLLDLL